MAKGRPVLDILCAYCGERPGNTRDHVIPRCLFGGPLPPDVITVRACRACNTDKSQDDDYLRDLLVTDVQATQHPIAQRLLQGQVIRAAQRNRSRVARPAALVSPILPRTPIRTPSGLYAGTLVTVPADPPRFQRVFATIVRGLYHHTYQRRLPPDSIFTTLPIPPSVELFEGFQFKGGNPIILGANIFGYIHRTMTLDDDPEVSDWLLWFYNSCYFVVTTAPHSKLKQNIAGAATPAPC